MATTITIRSEIPDAAFYVTCTDTFMSFWGQAEGKRNRLILPCRSIKEAEVVASNARGRSDTSHVRICGTRPRLLRQDFTLWQVMDRQKARAWYTPGRWSK